MSFPGLSPEATDLRSIVAVVIRLLAGKTNNVTTITLDADASTATLTDSRIGAGSFIGFTPTNPAATVTPVYVSAKYKGSAALVYEAGAMPLTALREYLGSLEVTIGALPGIYEGGWRVATNGRISPYFMFSGMTLAPGEFGDAAIQAACAMVIDQMTVGRRANSSAYAEPTLVCFTSGKVFFCNIGGTTDIAEPSDVAITVAAQTLVDGTVTWEYTGLALPATWQWYPIEIEADLFEKLQPDSNDSYAAMLITACVAGNVDATWLNAASAHPGKTRIQVLALLASNCISDDITNNLSATFQSATAPDGSGYTVQWLADNCESWHGMKALASLHTTVGDAGAATAATAFAATLKTGILSLWDSSAGRFRAYYGETGVESQAGETDFVQRMRFHIWPLLHGVLSPGSETTTYGEAVHAYIAEAVPTLFTGSLDSFVLGEYFFVVAEELDVAESRATLIFRALERYGAAGATVCDAALALAATDTDPTYDVVIIG